MTYFDDKESGLMLGVLGNMDYPCLPLYECIEDDTIVNEINIFTTKLYNENKKNKEMINELLELIKGLEEENNELCKENGNIKTKIYDLKIDMEKCAEKIISSNSNNIIEEEL